MVSRMMSAKYSLCGLMPDKYSSYGKKCLRLEILYILYWFICCVNRCDFLIFIYMCFKYDWDWLCSGAGG